MLEICANDKSDVMTKPYSMRLSGLGAKNRKDTSKCRFSMHPNESSLDCIIFRTATDIACGSGVFLEEAYQFIIDYCEKWYLENNPDYLLEMENGKKKLPSVA